MRIRVIVENSTLGANVTFGLCGMDFKVLTVLQYITDLHDADMCKIMDLPKAQMYGAFHRLGGKGYITQHKRGKALDLIIHLPPQTLLLINNNKVLRVKKQNKIKLVQEKQVQEKQVQEKQVQEKEKSKNKLKKNEDKWAIANNSAHPQYKLIHKAIAHGFEDVYAKIRKAAGAGSHYNKNGSQNKYFFKAAVFCHEHGVDPAKYVKFAQEAYSWVDDMSFPAPANISGDWVINQWMSRPKSTVRKKGKLGGHSYAEPDFDLKVKLAQAGFANNYTDGDCRFIASTAKDFNEFGTLDVSTVKFSDEIKWLSTELKAGGVL